MKKKLALLLVLALVASLTCGFAKTTYAEADTDEPAEADASDQAKADEVAALIDAIYVQTRTDETDEQCAAAKAAWEQQAAGSWLQSMRFTP